MFSVCHAKSIKPFEGSSAYDKEVSSVVLFGGIFLSCIQETSPKDTSTGYMCSCGLHLFSSNSDRNRNAATSAAISFDPSFIARARRARASVDMCLLTAKVMRGQGEETPCMTATELNEAQGPSILRRGFPCS